MFMWLFLCISIQVIMGGNEILLKISEKKRNPESLLAYSKPDCDLWKKISFFKYEHWVKYNSNRL